MLLGHHFHRAAGDCGKLTSKDAGRDSGEKG